MLTTKHSFHRWASVAAAGMLLLVPACGRGASSASDQETVTVYTARHYGIEPVFDAFTEATGIRVEFTTGKDPELRERLAAEGANTKADLLMFADAANMELADRDGLLAPTQSQALDAAIPEELRSEDGTWYALSRRARVVMYSTERVDDPPATYAEVGDPAWKGKLCLRPSTHPYTQSLVASLIIDRGPDEAREIVDSWVANDPIYIDSDVDIIAAVRDGDCDVALANSYYLGRMASEQPGIAVAPAFPEQDGAGTHVNVSAAAVTEEAPNPAAARRLLEWLATDGQEQFADANFEYPADPNVEPAELIAGWGDFRSDLAAVRQLGDHQAEAVAMLAEAGYE